MIGDNRIFLEAATRIGFQVAQQFYGDFRNVHEAKNCSFYDGSSGVAIFLGQLYKATRIQHFKDMSKILLHNAWKVKNEALKDYIEVPGFHSGWMGLAYASILVGKLFNEEKWIEDGFRLIEELNAWNYSNASYDLTYGAAGMIPALIQIYRFKPNRTIPILLEKLGFHIISGAYKEEKGWSWKSIPDTGNNLTGYSHGAAGIMQSLFELYLFFSKSEYYHAAVEALRYEDYFFNEQEQNWPDFRKVSDEDEGKYSVFPCKWCNGAAGIGLSRVRAYQITKNPKILEEANIAIKTTLSRSGFDKNKSASMCHGELGNAELFLTSGIIFQDNELIQVAVDLGLESIQIHQFNNNPWINGLGDSRPIPGFMLGLSGIGYFFLRLFDPYNFPSYLLLSGSDNL